ncbi:hypothetical protein E2C01_069460 [Portunus trituberculatus]|uniref:Uncharacterized protein n=1 Tax=Portunus trituberculatus TaxID=210409 RepID=A0A5B7HZE9_PORTR|nr:hypothetical protein [Portunus trituberculatus]
MGNTDTKKRRRLKEDPQNITPQKTILNSLSTAHESSSPVGHEASDTVLSEDTAALLVSHSQLATHTQRELTGHRLSHTAASLSSRGATKHQSCSLMLRVLI